MGWFSMDGWASSLIGSAGATRRDIEQFNALPVIIREYFPRSHIQLANGLLRVLDPVAQSLGGQPLSGGKAIMGNMQGSARAVYRFFKVAWNSVVAARISGYRGDTISPLLPEGYGRWIATHLAYWSPPGAKGHRNLPPETER
ncbi:uncharacterized protein PG998_007466 [Apiospora kogelbergensis]|uniref:uncharacterized protein n=1 Tax=Apiospora kogelbergensis TaxID=1337665 RepID=UPI00312F2D8E